jgi:hypothetical protein
MAIASLITLGLVTTSCSSSEKPAPRVTDSAGSSTDAMKPTGQNLYADMNGIVSVKELMRDLLDPLSDNVFDAIGTVDTEKGAVDTLPKTDADWDKIRIGATALVEGSYLLRVKRPFAPAGDSNNSEGPEPMELSPVQIQQKVDKDTVLWLAKIEALRNVGLQALDVVKRRQANELWDVASNLDDACENCHLEYWYPSQKALLDRLDRNLREQYGKPDRTGSGK